MNELDFRQKILEDEIKDQKVKIGKLEDDLNDLRVNIGERILNLVEKTQEQLETRTPSKLFYLFIGTFTVLYIAGIITVYTKSTQNALIFEKGITSIRITQTELKEKLNYTATKSDQVENEIIKLRDKIDEAVKEIRKLEKK